MLHDGVLEGRRTFGNVMKYILMGDQLELRQHVQHGRGVAVPAVPADAADADPAQQPALRLSEIGSRSTMSIAEALAARALGHGFIRASCWSIGPLSSLFDFLTFAVLL